MGALKTGYHVVRVQVEVHTFLRIFCSVSVLFDFYQPNVRRERNQVKS